MKRIGSVVIAATLAFGACGGSAPSATEGPESASSPEVTIEAIAFEPADLEVSVGDTVIWTNEDAEVKHTVTSGKPGDRGVPGLDNAKPDKPDGVFDGTVADAGDTFEFTFEKPGTFAYFCRVHPAMTATITVTN